MGTYPTPLSTRSSNASPLYSSTFSSVESCYIPTARIFLVTGKGSSSRERLCHGGDSGKMLLTVARAFPCCRPSLARVATHHRVNAACFSLWHVTTRTLLAATTSSVQCRCSLREFPLKLSFPLLQMSNQLISMRERLFQRWHYGVVQQTAITVFPALSHWAQMHYVHDTWAPLVKEVTYIKRSKTCQACWSLQFTQPNNCWSCF